MRAMYNIKQRAIEGETPGEGRGPSRRCADAAKLTRAWMIESDYSSQLRSSFFFFLDGVFLQVGRSSGGGRTGRRLGIARARSLARASHGEGPRMTSEARDRGLLSEL